MVAYASFVYVSEKHRYFLTFNPSKALSATRPNAYQIRGLLAPLNMELQHCLYTVVVLRSSFLLLINLKLKHFCFALELLSDYHR